MQSVSGLLYSLYRITLVDEYEYAAMVTVDSVMAPLLCGTFLAASSILCVNLLVALLTDTFQRSEVTQEADVICIFLTVTIQAALSQYKTWLMLSCLKWVHRQLVGLLALVDKRKKALV